MYEKRMSERGESTSLKSKSLRSYNTGDTYSLRSNRIKIVKDINLHEINVEDLILTENSINYVVSWKDLIFLPFINYSVYIFFVINFLSVHIHLYHMGYRPPLEGIHYFLFYATEVCYILHTVLIFFHRIMALHRTKRYYDPVPIGLLILDILSILPVRSLFMLFQRFNWRDIPISWNVEICNSCLRLLRIFRMIMFYVGIRDEPGYNQKLVLIITHFVVSSLVTQIIGIAFYQISCYQCETDNWSNILEDYKFNPDSKLEWFITVYTIMQSLLHHNSISLIVLYTMAEFVLGCITMYLGFSIHYMYLYGSLISEYICEMRYKLTFENRLQYIMNYVRVIQMPNELVQAIVIYYKLIWNTRQGLIQKPPAFFLFPESIQMEITTDIYWEAIAHSQIFSTFDTAFKRELSTVMTTVTYMEGQFIYQKRKIKSRMIYLVSGIIELISEESDRSSVLSFSPGTILGEIDCIMPSISTAKIRCATVCEFQVLEYQQLWMLMGKYKKMSEELIGHVNNRIQYARYKRVFKNISGGEQVSHIFWIKDQWRKIVKHTNNPSKYPLPANIPSYSSKYLNLLVLSSSDELKVHSICIRGSCSFVMDANSSFRIFLHYIFLMSIIIQLPLTTYLLAFEGTVSLNYYPLLTLLDIVYMLDIYIQSITAQMVHNVLITKPTDVVILRSRQFSFIVDVVASIPFDGIAFFLGHDVKTMAVLRIPKLLKIYKILAFFQEKERKLTTHVIGLQFVKFASIHVIIITMIMNLEHVVVCGFGKCGKNNWLYYTGDENEGNTKFLMFYNTFNLYFGDLVQTVVMSDVVDMMTMNVVVLIGFYMVNFYYVQISATSALKQMDARNFSIYLELLETFIHRRVEVRPMSTDIINYAKLQWDLCKGLTCEDLWYLMDQNSQYLRTKMRKNYVMKHLKRNELFNWLSDEILDIIAEKIRFYLIPPDSIIVPPMKLSYQLYIIVKGYCEMMSVMPGDLEKGSKLIRTAYFTFPMISVLHQVPSFIRVRTITTTFCMSLSVREMTEIIKKFPIEHKIFKTAKGLHMDAHYTIINRVFSRVNKEARYKSMGKVDTFTYKINESIDPLTNKIQRPTTCVSKCKMFISYAMQKTYDPNARGYEIYETSRAVVIGIYISFVYMKLDRTVGTCIFEGPCLAVYYIFMASSAVDIFVRSHLQYYNEIGIKVTHVKLTCRNYMRNAFIIDFISLFPFYDLKIHMLFGKNNHMMANSALLLMTRPLQLYRPYFLCLHKVSRMTARKAFIMKHVINAMVILFVLATFAAIRLLLTCHLSNKNVFTCPENSWISVMQEDESWSGWQLFVVSLYSVLSIANYKSNEAFTTNDYVWLFVFTLLVNITTLIYIVRIIGDCIFDDTKLVAHQNLIKNYLRFIRNKSINFKTKSEMLEHVANVWRKSKGESPTVIFETFPSHMQQEILSLLWKSTLMKTSIFHDQEETFFRALAPLLREYHFKKDGYIIRCNDVQSNIYIVSKGSVKITLAGTEMELLNAGGLFGCLSTRYITRQTIEAKAVVHTRLLYIKALPFFEIIKGYPMVKIRLEKIEAENGEYVAHYLETGSEKSIESLQFTMSRFNKVLTTTAIHEDNVYFMIFDYLTSVHFASISSILSLYFLVILQVNIHLKFWIFVDIYYTIFMCVRSIVSFTDSESGILVVRLPVIFKRYFQSFNFIIWLITTIPFYLVYECLYKGKMKPIFFLFNKSFRILYLIDYYLIFVERGNVPKHIQTFFLMYLPIFIIHATFVLWWGISYHNEAITTDIIANVYLHIINVFTLAGIDDLEQNTFVKVGGNLVVVIVGHCLHIYLMVAFSKMLLTHNFNIQNYKISVERFKVYCHKNQISPPITRKSMEYLMYLYREQNGEQIPELLNSAPPYIQQDHMLSLYGEHFDRHLIFSLTHVDFLRQLMMHLHRHIYLPGNLIVEMGDRNGTIYFIEDGYIAAIDQVKERLTCTILKKNQSFGELPGLSKLGYEKTFRALTMCVVLSIKRTEWKYLLQWFPASREIIYKTIVDLEHMFN